MTLTSIKNNLFDIAVISIIRQVDKLIDALPVVVLLGALNVVSVSTSVLDGQNGRARGMNQPKRALSCVVLSAFGNCLGRCNVITVGEVWRIQIVATPRNKSLDCKLTKHYVSIFDLFYDDIRGIQITVNNPDVWVLGLDLLCLVLVADQSRQLPVRMGIGDCVKSIASNIS